ncbi:unnamed protein product [Nesidiocoris tenuis]|uniref:Tyr recombinase domain-containing protein n=1 Tax=Nesidiocoris tenuis TaxID=355587 RepID=A0A6H5GKE1_9HEMI|nr:unnamed protein product [Nesidiocoris tenuis]
MEREKCNALSRNSDNYNARIDIPPAIIPELQWWLHALPHSVNNLRHGSFQLEINSDASLSGWGGFCNGTRAHGGWDEQFRDRHINFLELQAIFNCLKNHSDTPPSLKRPYPGGRSFVREAFLNKDIPEDVISTLLDSLAPSTMQQYQSSLRLWWDFCQETKCSPFTTEIPKVLTFLQRVLDNHPHTFNTFNTHRAAISLIGDRDIGHDPSIRRFLKGIFRKRPPGPRYSYTWDPQLILEYFETSSGCDVKFVSKKLATLLCLSTGHRLQTIHSIKISNIHTDSVGVTIYIPDLIKSSRPNSTQPCLKLPFFDQKPALCVARCLDSYLDLTRPYRPHGCDQLFITWTSPFGPATKQTMSRWMKDTMSSAGIDCSIFKPHSIRHASTSTALRRGLSIELIQKTVGWSVRSTTFAKFYNRPIVDQPSFLNSVLTSS